MEWSRAKTNRVLPRKCTGHSKYRLPTTQEKTLHMDFTRWSTPKSDWLYSLQPKMEKLYIVNKIKTRSWLWLRSWTPYYQIQTEIEVGKTARPFRYDLNLAHSSRYISQLELSSPVPVHFSSLIPKCWCSLLPFPVWPLPICLDSWT